MSHVNNSFAQLFRSIEQAIEPPPKNLLAAIKAQPHAGTLPSPWETWLLISLYAHERRQKWALRQLRNRLPDALPPSAEVLRQEQPVETFLPGRPDWKVVVEARFQPPYVFLDNRGSGEGIFVDIPEDGAAPLTFAQYLLRDAHPDIRWEPAARLRELCPRGRDPYHHERHAELVLIRNGLLEEISFNLVGHDEDAHLIGHRLTKLAMNYGNLMRRFCRVWRRSDNHLWIAAVVGDWLLAEELAIESGNADLIELTSAQAQKCREVRLEVINQSIGDGPSRCRDLLDAHNIDPDSVDQYVQKGLTGDKEACAEVAAFLRYSDDPRWCNEAYVRIASVEDPEIGQWRGGGERELARYLVQHNHRPKEVLDRMANIYCLPYEAAMLALEFTRHLSLPLIRKALTWGQRMMGKYADIGLPVDQDDPYDVMLTSPPPVSMAIILAFIDMPWSRQELLGALDVLAESRWTNRTRAISLVLALDESCDAETRKAAASWVEYYDPSEFEQCQVLFRSEMRVMEGHFTNVCHRKLEPIES